MISNPTNVSDLECHLIFLPPNLPASQSSCLPIFLPPNLPVSQSSCLPVFLSPSLPVSQSSCLPVFQSSCLPIFLPPNLPVSQCRLGRIHNFEKSGKETSCERMAFPEFEKNDFEADCTSTFLLLQIVFAVPSVGADACRILTIDICTFKFLAGERASRPLRVRRCSRKAASPFRHVRSNPCKFRGLSKLYVTGEKGATIACRSFPS